MNVKKLQDEDNGGCNDSLIEGARDIDIPNDLNNSSALQTPHKRSKDIGISENLNNSSESQTTPLKSIRKYEPVDVSKFEQLPHERHSGEVGKSTPEHSNCNRKNDHGKSYDKKQKGNKNSFKEDKIQNKGHSKSHEDEKECDFLEEIDQNLFKLPKEYSLAHCVAEDLRMETGIAVEFKRMFGGVGKLFDQKLKVGDVGIVNSHEQNAFYLIIKAKANSSSKKLIITLEKTLHKLLEEMKKRELTKLGIPTIGCGLGGLKWCTVKALIKNIFAGSGIHITVCIPSKVLSKHQKSPLKVYFSAKNLWEIELQTDRILFIDIDKIHKNNWIDAIVEKVNDTYQFKEKLLNDIKMNKLNPGDITVYNVKNEFIICAFVKQSELYYTSLEKVFENIKCYFKTSYRYFAFQSSTIKSDVTLNNILTIVHSIIKKSELWLCCETKMEEKKCDFFEEIDEDIFKLPKEYALAHCVAEDLRMGAGLAVKFKEIFGGVDKLRDQKLKVGDVGFVIRQGQNTFYLIIKEKANGRGTKKLIIILEKTLHKLLKEMKIRKLTKLGLPTIGCGLGGLKWSTVKVLIMRIFAGSGIHITVCIPSKEI